MKIEQLDKINKEIFNCMECEFHKQIKDHNDKTNEAGKIFYRPDMPLNYGSHKGEFKAIAVGINPAWDHQFEKGEWRKLYQIKDFDKYKERLSQLTQTEPIYNNKYRDGLAKVYNEINEHLKINKEEKISNESIYNYLFWANLSFCNSQTPWERKFLNNITDPTWICRVFSEEILNCLDKQYLSDIIEVIQPKLVLFFTITATHYIYYKILLKKIFDCETKDIVCRDDISNSYPAYTRSNGKNAEVALIPSIIRRAGENDIKILFLPHPNFRFNSELQKEAIKEVCEWLNNN